MSTLIPDMYSKRFRKRPPRIFGEDQLIIPYNYDHSVGNEYIHKLGYKVKPSEEFKWVENDWFKVGRKQANFCLVLTDLKLYIVRIKRFGVVRLTDVKLHKLKQLDVFEKQDNHINIDIVGYVPISGQHKTIHLAKMDASVAKELADSLQRVMATLNMDLQVKLHR